jgi:hypothetical protein
LSLIQERDASEEGGTGRQGPTTQLYMRYDWMVADEFCLLFLILNPDGVPSYMAVMLNTTDVADGFSFIPRPLF